MNTKNWILVIIILIVSSFLTQPVREWVLSTVNIIGSSQQNDESTSNSDFWKNVKIEDARGIKSLSGDFTAEGCKQLLKEWQPDIDNLEFRKIALVSDQSSLDIPNGRRYVTFIHRNDNTFEGCNVLDAFDTNLDKKEKEIEKYFDCEKENCKDNVFENGRFLYVYETSEKYNILKYLLRKQGKPEKEAPSLTFQILYIAKDMNRFIGHKISSAEQGYGCGTEKD